MKLNEKIGLIKKGSFTYSEEVIYNQLDILLKTEFKNQTDIQKVLDKLLFLNKEFYFDNQGLEDIINLIFQDIINKDIDNSFTNRTLFHTFYNILSSIQGYHFTNFNLGLYFYLKKNNIQYLTENFFSEIIHTILKNPIYQRFDTKLQGLALKYVFTGILVGLFTKQEDYGANVAFMDICDIKGDLNYSEKIKLNATSIINIINGLSLKINLSSDNKKAILSSFLVADEKYNLKIFHTMTKEEHDKLLEIEYKDGIQLDDFTYLLNLFKDCSFDNSVAWKTYFSQIKPFLENGDIRILLALVIQEDNSEGTTYHFVTNEKWNGLPCLPFGYAKNLLIPFYAKELPLNEDIFAEYLSKLMGNELLFKEYFYHNGIFISLISIINSVLNTSGKMFLTFSDKNIDKIIKGILDNMGNIKEDYFYYLEIYKNLAKTLLLLKEQKKSWLPHMNGIKEEDLQTAYLNAFIYYLKETENRDLKLYPISFNTTLFVFKQYPELFVSLVDNLVLKDKVVLNTTFDSETKLKNELLNNENKDILKNALLKIMNHYKNFNTEDKKKVEGFIKMVNNIIG